MEMKRAMQPAISKEELGEQIERIRGELRRIDQAYQTGYLSEQERARSFDTEIQEGFFRYLESRGLYFLPHISKNWHRFLEDYDFYKKNREPNSRLEDPWLRYHDRYDSETVYEASLADKVNFFILMDEFHILASYFRPLP